VVTQGHPGYEGKLTPLLSSLIRIERTRGTLFAIEYVKGVRLALLHHLSGETQKKVKGVAVFHDGIPKVLGPLVKDIRQGYSPKYYCTLRNILTLLFSTRALSLGKNPDMSPITNPCKGNSLEFKRSIGKHVRSFWTELGFTSIEVSLPRALRWREFHFTTKSGPNGHALWTSMNDLWIIPETELSNLFILGGKRYEHKVRLLLGFKDYLIPMFAFKGEIRRKISWFPDKELKTRVVAIGDFWSQTALIPLHQYLFRQLRKIPQDCTFAQSSFKDKVKDWTEFYSIDLSNATDRFPIYLITLVLMGRFPKEYCRAWEQVMVGTPFVCKHDSTVKSYSVGNPMGFYSSWNSFALAHHYVMFFCCKELGISWKQAKYVMLGDDVLIGDRNLANKYKQVLTDLGVDFSPLKTHESTKLYEFAKRLVLNGVEITPFPISALKETQKRFYLLVTLFREEMERGWIPLKGIPEAIFSYYKIVKGFNSKYAAKFRDRSYTCEIIMKMMRGTIRADEAINSIIRRFGIQLEEQTLEDSDELFKGFLYEAFICSDPVYSENKESLGLLAEDLTMKITGIETEDFEQLFEIPSSIPILFLYGKICEKWQKLRQKADGLFTLTLSEWTITSVMTVPISDRIFVERQSHTVARASAIMGDKLVPALRSLERPAWTVTYPS